MERWVIGKKCVFLYRYALKDQRKSALKVGHIAQLGHEYYEMPFVQGKMIRHGKTWMALMDRISAPDVVISDDGTGFAKARRRL